MRKGKRFRKTKKTAMLLVSLIMVLTVAVGGSLAYLVTKTDPVENSFTVEQIPIKVEETFNGKKKEDVKIKHLGGENGRDAYVRAAIVVNWVDSSGNVCAQAPKEGVDYEIQMGKDWKKVDGYWYYNDKLEAKAATTNLIETCRQKALNSGYQLSVEILAQSIQADGVRTDSNQTVTPIEEAWGRTAASFGIN